MDRHFGTHHLSYNHSGPEDAPVVLFGHDSAAKRRFLEPLLAALARLLRSRQPGAAEL